MQGAGCRVHLEEGVDPAVVAVHAAERAQVPQHPRRHSRDASDSLEEDCAVQDLVVRHRPKSAPKLTRLLTLPKKSDADYTASHHGVKLAVVPSEAEPLPREDATTKKVTLTCT